MASSWDRQHKPSPSSHLFWNSQRYLFLSTSETLLLRSCEFKQFHSGRSHLFFSCTFICGMSLMFFLNWFFPKFILFFILLFHGGQVHADDFMHRIWHQGCVCVCIHIRTVYILIHRDLYKHTYRAHNQGCKTWTISVCTLKKKKEGNAVCVSFHHSEERIFLCYDHVHFVLP